MNPTGEQFYAELKALVDKKELIDGQLKSVKTIAFNDNHGHAQIHLSYSHSRYNFGGIREMIGTEKFDAIVNQFSGLLEVELHRAKQQNEAEMSRYDISKNE